MIRLLTLVTLSLVMAFAPAFGEEKSDEESERIHITAEIIEQCRFSQTIALKPRGLY